MLLVVSLVGSVLRCSDEIFLKVFINRFWIFCLTFVDDYIAAWILNAILLLICSNCNSIIPSTLEIICAWNSIKVLLTISLMVAFIWMFYSSIFSDVCSLFSSTSVSNSSFQLEYFLIISTVDLVTNELLSLVAFF